MEGGAILSFLWHYTLFLLYFVCLVKFCLYFVDLSGTVIIENALAKYVATKTFLKFEIYKAYFSSFFYFD